MGIGYGFLAKLTEDVRSLHPGYFALVMATGIVSIAAYSLGLDKIAHVLLGINIISYGVLWSLTLGRLAFFPRALLKDFCSYELGPTFFTIPAGSCVLGSQVILLSDSISSGVMLWGIGLISWISIMYGFFYAMTIASSKPTLGEGLSGAWSIPVVATFGITILSTLLAVRLPMVREMLLFIALTAFLMGSMLYVFIITLMFYRFFFFPFTPAVLAPPYWINMGIEAIAALGGTTLILNAASWAFLEEIQPLLKGMTLAFWAVSNWWFPLLLLLGIWRHVVHQIPVLRYNMQYWSLVFPLGMYTACTFQLKQVINIKLFELVPIFSMIIALVVWVLTFAGLCYQVGRRYIGKVKSREIEIP
jgi:tellurite resistance protein TehA-like permease